MRGDLAHATDLRRWKKFPSSFQNRFNWIFSQKWLDNQQLLLQSSKCRNFNTMHIKNFPMAQTTLRQTSPFCRYQPDKQTNNLPSYIDIKKQIHCIYTFYFCSNNFYLFNYHNFCNSTVVIFKNQIILILRKFYIFLIVKFL